MKMVLIVVIFLGAITGSFLFYSTYFSKGKGNEEVQITIQPNTSVRSFVSELKKKGVIRNEELFLLWIKFHNLDKSIQAGTYSFITNDGILNTTQKLRSAKALEKEVTIPEGLTIEQTCHSIRTTFQIDSVEFCTLCSDPAFIQQLDVPVQSLEGYLFPQTYRFTPLPSVREIISKMVKEFKKQYATIPQDPRTAHFTQQQIVILASIIEKEAALPQERTHIAGVFHNRLRISMPLGADPTIRYIFKKFDGPLRVSELRVKSPYNTRIYAGLPPTAICSPGLGALRAAHSPLNTKDLYFVAKWDGSGAHDFSQTLTQHVSKTKQIRKNNDLRIRKQKVNNEKH